jgi:tetratricopeptide (TPR) repeat protein
MLKEVGARVLEYPCCTAVAARTRATGTALRILSALGQFWFLHGHLSEGRGFLERALRALSEDNAENMTLVRARALSVAGYLAFRQHAPHAAIAYLEESLTLYRERGDIRARRMSEESVALMNKLGAPHGASEVMTILAYELVALGELTDAGAWLEKALALVKERENTADLVRVLCGLGQLALRQDRLAEARSWFEKGVTKMQGRWLIPRIKCVVASCLEGLGEIAHVQGQTMWAVQLFAAAQTVRAANGFYTAIGIEQPAYDHTLEEARCKFSEQTFAAMWEAGLEMTPQQALAAETQEALTPLSMQNAKLSPAKLQTCPGSRHPQRTNRTRRRGAAPGGARVEEQPDCRATRPQPEHGQCARAFNLS